MATILSKRLLSASFVITVIATPVEMVKAQELMPAVTVAQQSDEAEPSEIEQRLQELEATVRKLRQGRIALTRQDVLLSRVIRVRKTDETQRVIDLMLRDANQAAVEALQPKTTQAGTPPKNIIQIPLKQVEKLKQDLQEGDEYVLRILSAGNYVQGESRVRVFADLKPNVSLFEQDERLAALDVNLEANDDEQVRSLLRNLLEQARSKALEAGVVSGRIIVGEGDMVSLARFHDALKQQDGTIQLRVVTAAPVSTAGPLLVHVQALKGDVEMLTTATQE